MKRFTIRNLTDWINSTLWEINLSNFSVHSITRTNFTQDAYEGGAARLIITLKNNDLPENHILSHQHFYCFYTMSFLEKSINQGYELYYKIPSKSYLIESIEIDIKKPAQ